MDRRAFFAASLGLLGCSGGESKTEESGILVGINPLLQTGQLKNQESITITKSDVLHLLSLTRNGIGMEAHLLLQHAKHS